MLTKDQKMQLFRAGWKSADVRKSIRAGMRLRKWGVFEKTEMVRMPTRNCTHTYKATITVNVEFDDKSKETVTFWALASTRKKALQRCYRAAKVYQIHKSDALEYLLTRPVKPLKHKVCTPAAAVPPAQAA
jgi:hypothetical protein